MTGEFTRWGGHVMQLFGAEPETWGYFKVIGFEGTPLDRIDGVMIIGMFAGCFAAALWVITSNYVCLNTESVFSKQY